MRILMFLRPTNRYGTKGEYTAFRKLLATNGFTLVQSEVFLAAVPTRRAAAHLLARLREQAPSTGSVCALVLTERQYASMDYLAGEPPYQDCVVGTASHISL